MRLFKLIVCCWVLAGCTVPFTVDYTAYSKAKEQISRQQASDHHPWIGLYRIISSSEKYVDSPSEAAPVKGDWVVAVLLRSGEIDFVSLSALTGYGALSDQGRNFSVNLHGAALWSFPASDSDELTGRSNGLLDGQVGEAIAALSGNGFLVVRVNSGKAARGNKMKQETYFLEKLED